VTAAPSGQPSSPVSSKLAAKIRWRIAMPTIFVMFLSSLDRVNISFASLQMNAELGLSPSQYGFASGIVFVGFLAGQYPSILLLQRIGFRRWLAALSIIWGIAAAGLAFTANPEQLYALRLIIGFAEGGIAPGIVLYLSQFATERERAGTFATPMLAIPLSIIFGGPISGWLLDMQAPGGLAAWRWMFLAEGLPTIVIGLVVLVWFPDTPEKARWLSTDEKIWLKANSASRHTDGKKNDWSALLNPLVWTGAALWFCLLSGAYGVIFWLPQMMSQLTGLTAFEIGLVSALPWIGAGLGMYFNAAHSDRTGERFWHVGLPAAACGLAILGAGAAGPSILGLVMLFIAGLGLGSCQGAFWALPTQLLSGPALALGVVTINIVGTSGGVIVPNVIGMLREGTGGFSLPTLLIGGVMLLGAALVVAIRFLFFGKPAREAA
jgi:ACS family tartrate transporter-like MFS transporter